jgi:hypothetical protein
VRVHLRIIDGEDSLLHLSTHTSISVIKRVFAKALGVGEDKVRLFFYEKQLDDGRVVGDYEIKDDDVIYGSRTDDKPNDQEDLQKNPFIKKDYEDPFIIHVLMPPGVDSICIKVRPTCTISQLRKAILGQIKGSNENTRIRLLFDGVQLLDGFDIGHHVMEENDTMERLIEMTGC